MLLVTKFCGQSLHLTMQRNPRHSYTFQIGLSTFLLENLHICGIDQVNRLHAFRRMSPRSYCRGLFSLQSKTSPLLCDWHAYILQGMECLCHNHKHRIEQTGQIHNAQECLQLGILHHVGNQETQALSRQILTGNSSIYSLYWSLRSTGFEAWL